MSYQFIHIETYARVASRNNKKQSASNIVAEAERVPSACPHVEHIRPPQVIYGCTPSEALQIAEINANSGTDAIGRKIRKDAQIILSGVASYPTPISELTDDDNEKIQQWLVLNHKFLKSTFGDDYKSCISHSDEEYFHIHFYVVPSVDSSNHFNIGSVHPGIRARDRIGGKKIKEKNAAYKKAMRDFQTSYYESVGRRCGLTKTGPKRRRLTRKEWALEKEIAANVANSLSIIDEANDKLSQLEAKELSIKKLGTSVKHAINIARSQKKEIVSMQKTSALAHLEQKHKNLLERVDCLERLYDIEKSDNEELKKSILQLTLSNNVLREKNNIKSNALSEMTFELRFLHSLIKSQKFDELMSYDFSFDTDSDFSL